MIHSSDMADGILLPKFSDDDIEVLKKYFEFNERYREQIQQELLSRIEDHPIWGPMISQMSPEQMKAQNQRSRDMQHVAIYEGKWKEYAEDLIVQGRAYARMNISYNDWYELIALAKVLLIPYVKRDFADSPVGAIDVLDGLSKFIDYAMYGIAEAYFQEKNSIIKSNEERFRIIFEASMDIILLIGESGEIIEINHATDYNVKDLIGKKIFDFQGNGNSETMKKAVEYVFTEKKAAMLDTEIGSGDDIKYYASTISPVIGENNSVNMAVVISRDITDRKKSQLELVNLNATLETKVAERTAELNSINKELESFTYSVSHDLRSPLRAVSGFSEILKEECAGHINEDASDALYEIDKNVRKMGQLIDDLLAFSRIGKQNISRALVDMNSIFETVVEDFKKNLSPTAEIRIGRLAPAHGDRTMLKQAVINLVSNAIKYSSKKDKPLIEIGCKDEKDCNVYYIKDNGVGFDMSYYDKLFGVFQRLHSSNEFEGTGVGLAIVQRIISRHSGKVWAEGKVNEGATFYFSLPKN